MKKLSLLSALVLWSVLAGACDFCNCYLGLNPHYKKNSIGLRYYLDSYSGSHHELSELLDNSITKNDFKEKRITTEFHAQFYPVQKLQLIVAVPYINNIETMSPHAQQAFEAINEESEAKETISGLGDPLVLAQYQIFNFPESEHHEIAQRLFAGGGLTLPLGKYRIDDDEDALERIHQPGTGGFDFLMSTSWLAKINRTGLNANITYSFSTVNSQNFRFGNKLNANLVGYYQIKCGKSNIYPSAGIYYESGKEDIYKGNKLYNSGGNVISAHGGIDLYFKRFSLTGAFEESLNNGLNQPQPQPDYKFIAGIGISIN